MSNYKPKTRKDPSSPLWCLFCHKEITVGETYHYIQSRCAGTRPLCLECAETYMRIYRDGGEEAGANGNT